VDGTLFFLNVLPLSSNASVYRHRQVTSSRGMVSSAWQ
jgi:hypothetical protein